MTAASINCSPQISRSSLTFFNLTFFFPTWTGRASIRPFWHQLSHHTPTWSINNPLSSTLYNLSRCLAPRPLILRAQAQECQHQTLNLTLLPRLISEASTPTLGPRGSPSEGSSPSCLRITNPPACVEPGSGLPTMLVAVARTSPLLLLRLTLLGTGCRLVLPALLSHLDLIPLAPTSSATLQLAAASSSRNQLFSLVSLSSSSRTLLPVPLFVSQLLLPLPLFVSQLLLPRTMPPRPTLIRSLTLPSGRASLVSLT